MKKPEAPKITLAPCPFCGGKAEMHVGLSSFVDIEIQCRKCSASGGCFDKSYTGTEGSGEELFQMNVRNAADHWNRRVSK